MKKRGCRRDRGKGGSSPLGQECHSLGKTKQLGVKKRNKMDVKGGSSTSTAKNKNGSKNVIPKQWAHPSLEGNLTHCATEGGGGRPKEQQKTKKQKVGGMAEGEGRTSPLNDPHEQPDSIRKSDHWQREIASAVVCQASSPCTVKRDPVWGKGMLHELGKGGQKAKAVLSSKIT